MNDFNTNDAYGQVKLSDRSKSSNYGVTTEIKRHPFISFWLWLSVIINGFVTLGYIGWYAENGFTWLPIMCLAGCALILSGYIMLLRWDKKGFYILSGACVFSMVIHLTISGFTMSIFTPIISVAILYFILHIKRGGIEYWDAMDMKHLSK